MAGSGVMRLRAARRSPRSLPISGGPAVSGRYSGAPKVADQMSPSAPKKPGTFNFATSKITLPKPIDRGIDGEGGVSRHAIRKGSSTGK